MEENFETDFTDDDFTALQRLKSKGGLEGQVDEAFQGARLATELLESAAPQAAMSIIHLATKDPNSRVRLSASQYILDKVIGKAQLDPSKSNPWDDVFGAVTDVQTSTK